MRENQKMFPEQFSESDTDTNKSYNNVLPHQTLYSHQTGTRISNSLDALLQVTEGAWLTNYNSTTK